MSQTTIWIHILLCPRTAQMTVLQALCEKFPPPHLKSVSSQCTMVILDFMHNSLKQTRMSNRLSGCYEEHTTAPGLIRYGRSECPGGEHVAAVFTCETDVPWSAFYGSLHCVSASNLSQTASNRICLTALRGRTEMKAHSISGSVWQKHVVQCELLRGNDIGIQRALLDLI